MESVFQEIKPENIGHNPFKLIGRDWMLITAGTKDSFNTMTGAWGGLGIMWNKRVAVCVVRPNRYTYEFMERSGSFSLSFFDEQYRDALTYCGTKSGRDVNKVAQTGLTPVFGEDTIYFAQASLVIECRKVYYQDIEPRNFLAGEMDGFYPEKDYHRMYVGEILRCLSR
ncbi:MAG: flavin reductase family protein [Syntrophorhabdaceae bacterium]|nr:flavin reductase family protein [Syntrophorhabdaceae bacterium]